MQINTVIEATVPSGFERSSLEEIAEKLPGVNDTSQTRGHIRFTLPNGISSSEQIKLLKGLRSVDNLYVVVGNTEVDFASKKDMKSGLLPIMEGMVNIEWQQAIEFWREFTEFKGDCLRNVQGKQLLENWDLLLEELDKLVINVEEEKRAKAAEEAAKLENPDVEIVPEQPKKKRRPKGPKEEFSFRCTSARSGDCHPFTSREVEMEVGGLLHDGFGWNVNLKNYEMEVFVLVRNNFVSYCLSLTSKSMHRRNADIQRLGNMSLRSTISYNMLRLCGIQLGDFVIDPMCGSGAIIVESMLSEFGDIAFHIAADLTESVIESKAKPSLLKAAEIRKIVRGGDCLSLNATSLPFRTGSVDVIVTDMPFGRRCGHKNINKWLYPAVLKEFARVLVPSTGRACLLTADVKNMNNAIWTRVKSTEETVPEETGESAPKPQYPSYWIKPYRSFTIHHGGLNPMVYLLKRSALAFI